MKKYKKILVVCPSNMTTGGPEALHQLVNHMVNMGLPACIVYTPFNVQSNIPQVYEKYQTPIGKYEDEIGNIIIFPEIYPMQAMQVKKADASLWWLSLGNFLERKNESKLRDLFHYIKAIIRKKRPINGARSLKSLIHFSQTQHSTKYLLSCNITPIPLIDSINEFFLNDDHKKHKDTKENIILFNPTKGKDVTEKLIKNFPEYKFIPLKGHKPAELSKLLYSAKLYIDFGQHPGRDRMPREAAIHGCCIISGILGSAGNDIDLPIPKIYKINAKNKDFIKIFEEISKNIFDEFDFHYKAFENYRNYLKSEPTIFKQQIADFFIKK